MAEQLRALTAASAPQVQPSIPIPALSSELGNISREEGESRAVRSSQRAVEKVSVVAAPVQKVVQQDSPREEDEWHTVPQRAKGKGPAAQKPTWAQLAGQKAPKVAPPPQQKPKWSPERREKAVDQMLAPKVQAAEFDKVFFQLLDPRPLLEARGPAQDKLVQAVLKHLDIRKWVSGYTVVPGPTIQVICLAGYVDLIRQALHQANLLVIAEVDPFAKPPHSQQSVEEAQRITANWLAFLCQQSHARNFHETALMGASPALRADTLTAYQHLTKSPKTNIGHEGCWYSQHDPQSDSEMADRLSAGLPDMEPIQPTRAE